LAVFGTCRVAYADPATAQVPGLTYVHILSDFDVKTSGGSQLHLDPGYYLNEPNWKKLDDAYKAKDDEDTRLTAENAALKKDMSGWEPGWYVVASALAVGLASGWYLRGKL
jgi:hypothetical protein